MSLKFKDGRERCVMSSYAPTEYPDGPYTMFAVDTFIEGEISRHLYYLQEEINFLPHM